MKLITLLQAGALLMLAVMGAYASGSDTASCVATDDNPHLTCEL